MDRFLPKIVVGVVALLSTAYGQVTSAESVVSSTANSSAVKEPASPSEGTVDIALDPASLLPDLPSLRPENATLFGGTVETIDRVQDRLTMQVFGGGRMKVLFDTRTRIYRDGKAASVSDLRPGDRVHVDTILNGTTIFARNIRMNTNAPVGESQGVVMNYRHDKGELLVRDQLSPEPLKVHISSATTIVQGDHAVPASQLAPGTLVALKFGAESESSIAREISVLALPGTSFTFTGQLTTLNLRTGLLVLTSATDHKTYEIYLDPSVVPVDDNLRQGADVTVLARFDGDRYTAHTVTVNQSSEK
ncbi:MAG: DUF5666 domain-containing protein [Acidobacteriia bacterium]|nr:DUF5666 domain-containing protein [Terriglobia bacterium]